MADRRRQIVLLLGTRFDRVWFPRGSMVTSAGLAPGERTPCADCGGVLLRDDFGKAIRKRKGSGVVRDRFGRVEPCATCGGHVDSDGASVRGAGWVERDRYASRVVLGSEGTSSSARPRRVVMCDACGGEGATAKGRCSRCDGSGKRLVHQFNLLVDTGERAGADAIDVAIDRRDEEGSYHELDLALAGVARHANKPLRYLALTMNAVQALRLLDEVFLPPAGRRLEELSLFESSLVELALAYIDERMPPIIRVPAGVAQNARERREHLRRARGRGTDPRALADRDRQIRRWALEGKPYPWICAQVGLGDRQLREIINGKGAAA